LIERIPQQKVNRSADDPQHHAQQKLQSGTVDLDDALREKIEKPTAWPNEERQDEHRSYIDVTNERRHAEFEADDYRQDKGKGYLVAER
jgi:hypothetical protein